MRLLYIFLLGLCGGNDGIRLTILHTNDFHSRFDSITSRGSRCREKDRARGECFGGISRLKRLVQDVSQSAGDDNTLFLNAGDLFQGTIWYTLFKWKIVANLTNGIGLTASSLGNHEFDDGIEDLRQFTDAVDYPLLAANVDISGEPSLEGKILPSMVVNVRGTLVGIIGYVTPETKEIASTGNVTFLDEISAIKKEIEKLKTRDGVKIFIALGHSGYIMDRQIAKEVEGVSIVIGGHTNTLLWNGPTNSYEKDRVIGNYPYVVKNRFSGKPVLVLQTNGYGKYLGKIDVVYDGDSYPKNWSTNNPIPLTQNLKTDEELDRIVSVYKEEIHERMKGVVGKTLYFMDGGRPKCRLEECSFGNLLADAMRYELDVPIAVINSGGIKGSFDPKENKGDITLEDIFRAMPWSNTIDVISVPGSTIVEMMEHSVSEYDALDDDPSGRFLQVSGLEVHYDVTRPAGTRVICLTLTNGTSVMKSRTYEIAINSFMVRGGDGYLMIPETLIYHKNTGYFDKDLFVSYIRKHSPLSLPVAGRLKFHHSRSSSSGPIFRPSKEIFILSFIVAWMIFQS